MQSREFKERLRGGIAQTLTDMFSIFLRAASISVMVALPLLGKDLDPIERALASPDETLVAYTTPQGIATDVNGKEYGYGTKLYVRLTGNAKDGVLLLNNDRWMAAQWGPHSHLLGIEDHSDGHISEVYVYEIEAHGIGSSPVCKLVFRAPENGYDVKWFIEGWGMPHRTIRLRKEWIRHPVDSAGKIDFSLNLGTKTEARSFVIGTKPLPPPQ